MNEEEFSVSVATRKENKEKQNNRLDFSEDVTKAQAGDGTAFESLYWKALPYLEAEARRYFDKPQDVEDALQDTFLKIYEKLGNLENPNAFLGWAIVTCKNTCLNKLDSSKRHTGKEDPHPILSTDEDWGLDILPADELRKDLNPNTAIDSVHVSETVREVLDSLPEAQQTCLLLWMEGYKTSEICAETGLSEGTVKSNIRYAKKKVGKTLEQMRQEGTFDYKAVHGDPLTAFLGLMERYLSTAKAVPSMGDSLLASLRPALSTAGVSVAAGASETAAATATATSGASAGAGVLATLRRAFQEPSTVILSVVMTIALAIGAAAAIQNYSAMTPVAPNEKTTRSAVQNQKQRAEADEIESEADRNANDSDTGNDANNESTPDTQNTPAITRAGGGGTTSGAGAGNSARTRSTTAESNNNGRLTATIMNDISAANQAAGVIGQVMSNVLSAPGSGRATGQISVWQTVYDPSVQNGMLTLESMIFNNTDGDITLTSIDNFTWKNTNGDTIAKASFDLAKPLTVKQNEYSYIKLTFPKGRYNEKLANAVIDGSASSDPNSTGHLNYTKTASGGTTIGRAYKVSGTPEAATYSTAKGVYLYKAHYSHSGSKVTVDVSLQNLTDTKVSVKRFEDFYLTSGWTTDVLSGDVKLDTPVTLKVNETCYLRMEFPESAVKTEPLSDTLLAMKYNAIYDIL